jgi:hypothetical protein
MNTSRWLIAGAVVIAAAGLRAQSLDVRPGMWEVTATINGAMPLQGVPPEMRAQVEAQLARPQVSRSCISADDIKRLDLGQMEDKDGSCRIVSSKMTSTSADMTRQCTDDGGYTDTAHFEAPTPQTMSATVERKGATGAMTIKMTARWMSAECTKD